MDRGYTRDRGVSGSQILPARSTRRCLVNGDVRSASSTVVKIHEYQAKQILRAYGVCVSAGSV